MIEHPVVGQRVVLRYAAHKMTGRRPRLHREAGSIEVLARGPGPRNVGVRLDVGGFVVVPRGNLYPEVIENQAGERQGVLWA